MHEYAFADAARPTPVVCLRLPLMPYSLGHEILLLQQRNPLLSHSAKAFGELPFIQQRQALIRAVLICSNDWRKNHQRQRWIRIWGWLLRCANWDLELAEFRNYLSAAQSAFPGPDAEADSICAKVNGYTPLKESRGRASGAPLAARLLHFVSHLDIQRFAVQTIYDFPFALANLLYETALEAEGSARIENLNEFEEAKNLKKIRAEVAAEQAAAKTEPNTGLATTPPDLKGGDHAEP